MIRRDNQELFREFAATLDGAKLYTAEEIREAQRHSYRYYPREDSWSNIPPAGNVIDVEAYEKPQRKALPDET